jgi:hypothetical protein
MNLRIMLEFIDVEIWSTGVGPKKQFEMTGESYKTVEKGTDLFSLADPAKM